MCFGVLVCYAGSSTIAQVGLSAKGETGKHNETKKWEKISLRSPSGRPFDAITACVCRRLDARAAGGVQHLRKAHFRRKWTNLGERAT